MAAGHEALTQDRARSRRSPVSRAVSFWVLAALLALFLFAASAPSPLYPVYQAMWPFPPITLTAIYAVYALGGLTALLTTGRLSDHLGRRRVVIVALVMQAAAMFVFIDARGVAMLFVARTLQGVATGIAVGAISAWLLDLTPPDNPRIGGVVGGIAVIAGLASGALGSSLLVEYGPDRLHLVFWLLTAAYAASFAAVLVMPDVGPRSPGWVASLRPEVGVPKTARSLFVALTPSLIATWALGGLYLSLGPSLAIALVNADSHIAGGLVIAALAGTGTLTSALVSTANPRAVVFWGSVVLIAGVGVTLAAFALGSTVGFYAGSVIAGIGFGPAFSAVVRSLAPLAPPDRRGALVAAVYVVTYVAFGLPAVIAGAAATVIGLRATTYGYGVVVMALAATTTIAASRRTEAASTTA